MISKFFKWWGRELVACFPRWLLRSSNEVANVLEIALSRDRIRYKYKNGGKVEFLGELDRHRNIPGGTTSAQSASAREALQALLRGLHPEKTRCQVISDDNLSLRKTFTLPLAAEENLEQVLAFEMERHTPFHSDQVYFDYRVTDRNTKDRRLGVEVLVMRKQAVDESLLVLEDWDLRPVKIGLNSSQPSLTLLPRDYRRPSESSFNRVLLATNFAALLFVLLIPIQKQESYLTELRESVDDARARALSSIEIQTQIDSLKKELSLLTSTRADSGSVVELIDELTRLLPDGTWLHRLEIRDREVHFQGFSESASALVGMVEASALFRDARFGSPITRDVRTGRERFHVSAKLSPRPQGLAKARPNTDREG